jgi:hypothetical protein
VRGAGTQSSRTPSQSLFPWRVCWLAEPVTAPPCIRKAAAQSSSAGPSNPRLPGYPSECTECGKSFKTALLPTQCQHTLSDGAGTAPSPFPLCVCSDKFERLTLSGEQLPGDFLMLLADGVRAPPMGQYSPRIPSKASHLQGPKSSRKSQTCAVHTPTCTVSSRDEVRLRVIYSGGVVPLQLPRVSSVGK